MFDVRLLGAIVAASGVGVAVGLCDWCLFVALVGVC